MAPLFFLLNLKFRGVVDLNKIIPFLDPKGYLDCSHLIAKTKLFLTSFWFRCQLKITRLVISVGESLYDPEIMTTTDLMGFRRKVINVKKFLAAGQITSNVPLRLEVSR